MRPLLKPALRRFWRGPQTLQIGTDPDRAVVLTDVDSGVARVFEAMDGARTTDEVVRQAAISGADPRASHRLLDLLASAGALDDGRLRGFRLHGIGATERERLAPDLTSLSLLCGTPDGGMEAMLRRRRATVAVYGAGRVGATIAVGLAAAGVERLLVVDSAPARRADLAPAGLGRCDLDGTRAHGVRRAIRAIAPSTRVPDPARWCERYLPEFAVVAPDEEPDRRVVDGLVDVGVPHLVARVVETRGIVGPLVIPGRTSCVRCADLYRAARDPAWPRLIRQVLSEPASAVACDVTLARLVADLAALHVLAYLAGVTPPSVNGTLEIVLPAGEQRRRTWPPNAACDCADSGALVGGAG